jgi:hypothetical protein
MRVRRPLGEQQGLGPKRMTLTDFHDAEPLVPVGSGRGGMPSKKDVAAMLSEDTRINSLRRYRQLVDEAIMWVRRGQMAPKDGLAYAGIIKAGAEMMMTEKILAANGQEDRAPVHADDATFQPVEPRAARRVLVKRETGVGADGNPIDIQTVEVEGGEDLGKEVPIVGTSMEE